VPPKKGTNDAARKAAPGRSFGLDDVPTFEKAFLKKAYFMGENKLDRVLLSLLHLRDVSSIETWKGKTYLYQEKRLSYKIKQTSKSIFDRYRKEKQVLGFNPIAFTDKYSIELDTVLGIYPLVFNDARIVFHSLKLSYALFLTLKMFKLNQLKSTQRMRLGKFSFITGNLLSQIFLCIFSQLKKLQLSEKDVVKCIKSSLCTLVSKAMNQSDLPPGAVIDLFPAEVHAQLKKNLEESDYVRVCFSCLQSKVMCEEVPEDFILDTLIKHRDQLSQPHRGLSPETLTALYQRGREFGRLVSKYYKPNKGFPPTNKATCCFPQNRGGMKGDLLFHERLRDSSCHEDPSDRMEPLVIGLFGQPGQGKSTRINAIVSALSCLFPGRNLDNLTYERTCHVDHWDGYAGQPITIFDDLGQAMDGSDIQEFQTLVSTCPYVLPMADLREKGIRFSSPVIICTSNLLYGATLKSVYGALCPIIDDASFWRRFHVPLYVEGGHLFRLRETASWVRPENLLKETSRKATAVPGMRSEQFSSHRYFQRSRAFDALHQDALWEPLEDSSFGFLLSLFRQRRSYHENFRLHWHQAVIDGRQDTTILDPLLEHLETFEFTQSLGFARGTGIQKTIRFDAFPPSGPLRVRVVPITEPLKVRVITAGEGSTFCLKPLQRAMWRALGDEQQFALTHGTNRLEQKVLDLFEQSSEGDVWISGDYTAATDSFSMEGSRAIMHGILESIEHEPTRRWAMKELSSHVLIYPSGTGIQPVLQESGQLMGSFLSFPLLCLLNDCTAKLSGLRPEQYLINGDDILMRGPETVYPHWKRVVSELGLDLSPGKNYVHARYGTINSQLIEDGRVVGSGKQLILDRRCRVLGECLRDLELAMPETPAREVQDLFLSVNRRKLSLTVRNLRVPCSHGGLSFSWGTESSAMTTRSLKTAKLCYLHDLFQKIKPTRGYIAIPYLSITEKTASDLREEERAFNDYEGQSEFHEDFLQSVDLQYVTSRCMTHSNLREILLNQPIENLPSLSFLRTYEVSCSNAAVRKQVQKEVDSSFLSGFLQGGQEFGYEVFRKEFLLKSIYLESSAKDKVQHIVTLLDLDVQPDFLKYMNLGFSPCDISKKSFEDSLGKSLAPKEFDIPKFSDFVDHTSRVIDDFKELGVEQTWLAYHDLVDVDDTYLDTFGPDGLHEEASTRLRDIECSLMIDLSRQEGGDKPPART